jgi:hypothetical protein
MIRRTTAALGAVALGASVHAAAAPAGAATPAPRTIEAEYVVTWLDSVAVYGAKMTGTWDGARYRVAFQVRSLGMIEAVARIRIAWSAEGTAKSGRALPAAFDQTNAFRGNTRKVALRYAGNGAAPSVSIAPPESPGKRPPVPEAMKRNTVDPLTAVFGAVTTPMDAKPCVYSAQVFEGLRRTDISFTFGRTARTSRLAPPGLPAEAVVCLLHAKRLAGYEDRAFKNQPEPLPPAELAVVRLPKAGIWLPVSLDFVSRVGPISARLVRVTVDGRPPVN